MEKLVKKKFDSKIDFDQNLVSSWLNKRCFISELLYRKSVDGSTSNDFHKKCDNKGITIIFIGTNKGYKFGGYTELEWDNKSKDKKDTSTFIFSLNDKIKYTPRNDNNCIYCDERNGPRFGDNFSPEIFFL